MNIVTVINARVASSRLERKMLLPLGDATFIEQVWRQAKKTSPVEVIAATSANPEDDAIVELAKRNNIPIVRGHATDVLDRYATVAAAHQVDGIVVWEGDCLLVDRRCVDRTIALLEQGYDYVEPKNLPLGTFCYGLAVPALKKVLAAKDDNDTEGWGRYLKQIPGFKITSYSIPGYDQLENIRLTLDYPEDYELLKKVFAFVTAEKPQHAILDQIASFVARYPTESQGNQNRAQEYWKRFNDKYSQIHLKKK